MHSPTRNPGPSAFLPSPGGAGPLPQPQPARVVAVERVAAPKRTHQADARLTLRLPNRVELNAEAMRATPLKQGAPVELICPRRGGGRQWLLDTRPTAGARLLERKGTHYFNTAAAPDTRYLPASTHPSRLAFDIGPELTEQVCVTLPATEVSQARTACETRGTGVFVLLPRRA